LKWNLKAKQNKVWLIQSPRMGPSGQSLLKKKKQHVGQAGEDASGTF
jgi:hypothetical protein